jgi:hypothetical protein
MTVALWQHPIAGQQEIALRLEVGDEPASESWWRGKMAYSEIGGFPPPTAFGNQKVSF